MFLEMRYYGLRFFFFFLQVKGSSFKKEGEKKNKSHGWHRLFVCRNHSNNTVALGRYSSAPEVGNLLKCTVSGLDVSCLKE